MTRGAADLVREVTEADLLTARERHGALDDVLELAHVSRKVVRIEGPERIGELAQMLAGAEGGAAARASAEELMERAAAWRQTARRG